MLSTVQWRQVVEKKAYRGRMWKMMGKEQYVREMWESFLQERSRVKRFRELADEEKQEAYRGRMWKMLGKEQCVRETWESFVQERSRVKRGSTAG